MSYVVLGGAGAQGRAIVRYLRQATEQMVISIDPAGSHIISDNFISWRGTLDKFVARYRPLLKGSVVISCLRPIENDAIVYKVEHLGAIGFIDLGGSDHHTTVARFRKRPYFLTRVLDCGLAPGLPSALAGQAVRAGTVNELKVLCGGLRALPGDPDHDFQYALSFSPHGLYGELTGTAQFIQNKKVVKIPTLYGIRYVEAPNTPPHLWPMQAAPTSGGLSFTPETLEGKLKTLTYETLRPAGHYSFLKENILWRPKDDAIRTMYEVFPAVSKSVPDLVLLGVHYDGGSTRRWYRWDYDHTNDISAMAQATGYVAAAVATMVYEEIFPRGILGMHDIDFSDILKTVCSEMPDQFKETNASVV